MEFSRFSKLKKLEQPRLSRAHHAAALCSAPGSPSPQPGAGSYPSAGLAAPVSGCEGKIKLPYKQTKHDFVLRAQQGQTVAKVPTSLPLKSFPLVPVFGTSSLTGMGHFVVFGLSGRGEGLGCGEEALMSRAALGLLHARVAARALQPCGQRGLTSLPALACTPEDKFSCIVANCMAAPCSTARHAAGGNRPCHVVPYPPLAPVLPQRCFHQNLLFCTYFLPHRLQHHLEQPAQDCPLGCAHLPPKCSYRLSSQGIKPGIPSAFQPLLTVTLVEQRLALAEVAEGGKPLMAQQGAAGCRQGMVNFMRCNFFQG